MYDNEDSVCGIICNDVPYYFKKNLQGDIIAIVDKDAKEVARYSYDAWGACTVVSASNVIGYANPFRYRGYYYDIENNLYYLNSRYYDPAVGRFINADEAVLSTLNTNLIAHNLFTYCYNNPIINADYTGMIGEAVAAAFTIRFGANVAGWILYVKMGSFLSAIFPYLLWAIAIIITTYLVYRFILAYQVAQAKSRIPNKLLKNGKVDLSKFTNRNGPMMPKGGRGILGPLS